MSLSDLLTNFSALRANRPGIPEIQEILDLLSRPAVLVELASNRLICANAQAVELTAYTRRELATLELPSLFSEVADTETVRELDRRKDGWETTLTIRRGGQVPVEIQAHCLDAVGQWALLLFEPLAKRTRRLASADQDTAFWAALHGMASAALLGDISASIQAAVQAGQRLLEASTLAVYQTLPDKPGFELYFGRGEHGSLPRFVSPVELSQLKDTPLWTPGRHTLTGLQRAARIAGFRYLYALPLGQSQAFVGLLLIADDRSEPGSRLVPIGRVLAAVLTTILRLHMLDQNLNRRLQKQTIDLAVALTIRDEVQDGIMVLGQDLSILSLNQSAELILGYATREAAGQRVDTILIGADSLIPALKAAQQGITTPDLGNIELHRRGGESFLAHLQTIPVMVNDQVARIVILMQDLSEREEYRVRTQQLEQRALLGEVTAIFAHEVRNPINNISTGLQLMERKLPGDDPLQEQIKQCRVDCSRLGHLMDAVLDFSRSTEYRLAPLDLEPFFRRLLVRWRPRMARVNVNDVFKLEARTPRVPGDARALEQVFNNLISNAIEAMSPGGGTLAVNIGPHLGVRQRKTVLIKVSDTGPGIPDEIVERIFDPFFSTKSKGTGLGLAITKRIVTAHKGNISVESFPGGTVFQIQLPAVEE